MRVLVTGANGFIGSACARALLEGGHEVHGVARTPPKRTGDVIWHRADLLDADALPGLVREAAPTHLLHVAWDVAKSDYWTAPANLHWLAAGAQLLQAFVAGGGERAVGVGTCAEYRWQSEQYNEHSTAVIPATTYGRCKLALYHAFEASRTLGITAAWGRIFFPFGPGEHQARVLASVISRLLRAEQVKTTQATQIRDFLYVDDVAGALVALLESSVDGAVNIGSGQGTALRTLISTAAKSIGAPELVCYGALPMRVGDPPSLVADVGRLRHEVGFRSKVSLNEGISRSVAHWRSVLANNAQ